MFTIFFWEWQRNQLFQNWWLSWWVLSDGPGKTPYDSASRFGHRNVMGLLDPDPWLKCCHKHPWPCHMPLDLDTQVFVALMSGRTCRCNSSPDSTISALKKEAQCLGSALFSAVRDQALKLTTNYGVVWSQNDGSAIKFRSFRVAQFDCGLRTFKWNQFLWFLRFTVRKLDWKPSSWSHPRQKLGVEIQHLVVGKEPLLLGDATFTIDFFFWQAEERTHDTCGGSHFTRQYLDGNFDCALFCKDIHLHRYNFSIPVTQNDIVAA